MAKKQSSNVEITNTEMGQKIPLTDSKNSARDFVATSPLPSNEKQLSATKCSSPTIKTSDDAQKTSQVLDIGATVTNSMSNKRSDASQATQLDDSINSLEINNENNDDVTEVSSSPVTNNNRVLPIGEDEKVNVNRTDSPQKQKNVTHNENIGAISDAIDQLFDRPHNTNQKTTKSAFSDGEKNIAKLFADGGDESAPENDHIDEQSINIFANDPHAPLVKVPAINNQIALITKENYNDDNLAEKTFPLVISTDNYDSNNKTARLWGGIDQINYKEKRNFLVRGGGIVARSLRMRKFMIGLIILFIIEILAISGYQIYLHESKINIAKQIILAIKMGEKFLDKHFINSGTGRLTMNEFKRENAQYTFDKNSFTENIIKIDFNTFDKFAIVYTSNAKIHLTGSHSVPDFHSACSIVLLIYVKRGVDATTCYDPNNHSGVYKNRNLPDWRDGWIDDSFYYLDKTQFDNYSDNLIKYFGRLKLASPNETIYPFGVGGDGIYWKYIALSPKNLQYINFHANGKSLKVYFSSITDFTIDDIFPSVSNSTRYDNVIAYFYDPGGLSIHTPDDDYGYFATADAHGNIAISLDETTQMLRRGVIQYNHNQYIKKPWSIDWSTIKDSDFTKGVVSSITLTAIFPSYVFLSQ